MSTVAAITSSMPALPESFLQPRAKGGPAVRMDEAPPQTLHPSPSSTEVLGPPHPRRSGLHPPQGWLGEGTIHMGGTRGPHRAGGHHHRQRHPWVPPALQHPEIPGQPRHHPSSQTGNSAGQRCRQRCRQQCRQLAKTPLFTTPGRGGTLHVRGQRRAGGYRHLHPAASAEKHGVCSAGTKQLPEVEKKNNNPKQNQKNY